MNIVKTWQTTSLSSADTSEIGSKLGRQCKGGELFLLVSDLGGGKTTLTQGLAKGLGSVDHVGSPTFTLNRVYKCRNSIELQHFDFYRLQDPGVVKYELAEFINEPHTVIAIEWGDVVAASLPEGRVEIRIERMAKNEDARVVTIVYPASQSYLLKELL